MTQLLRKWATPLVAATFLVTAVTGVVLYFHAGGSLSRVAHIWIGFAVCAIAIGHVLSNWRPARNYLKKPLAATILVAGVLATVMTSVNFAPANAAPGANPGMVFGALSRAPVSALAALSGETPEALVATFQARGYDRATPDSTIAQLTQGNQAKRGQLIALALSNGK